MFVRSGTTWTQQAKLTASDAQASDDFGWNVDIDKDHIVVAAYGEDTGGSGAGAIEQCQPFGMASYETSSDFRSIRLSKIN